MDFLSLEDNSFIIFEDKDKIELELKKTKETKVNNDDKILCQ